MGGGESGIKAGFTLSRGVQPAARRNRIKRLLRESYRRNKHDLTETATQQGKNIELVFLVVLGKKGGGKKTPGFQTVDDGVKALLKQVESDLRTTAS